MRQDVTFKSGKETCAAWLYLPEANQPAPVIVMAHGLGGVREMRLDAFAEVFCNAGYACLVFDYRHFGASGGEPRQLLDIKKQLEDWKNAIEYVKSESKVDGSRTILWGTSFGGGHVLKVAATQPGVAGVISQCPFTNGIASSLRLHPLSSVKVSGLAIADILTSRFRKTPIMVNLTGSPGDAALMAASDAIDGVNSLKPENHTAPEVVAARFGFKIANYFPGISTSKIMAPTLVIACLKDSVAPVKPTLSYARKLPQGEVVELDTGHFDIYVGDWFKKNIRIQLDWLARHFPL
jgi:dienelactone hydrolase